mmetsp:Transcript_13917/g.39082  ORF Transcript_13917/g.39082 Transcript_13917/m.39082 type:complete len:119 (+) Transcript_13917:49-405(+)
MSILMSIELTTNTTQNFSVPFNAFVLRSDHNTGIETKGAGLRYSNDSFSSISTRKIPQRDSQRNQSTANPHRRALNDSYRRRERERERESESESESGNKLFVHPDGYLDFNSPRYVCA